MESSPAQTSQSASEKRKTASALILLVDSMTGRMTDMSARLQGLGYRVLTADSVDAAARISGDKFPDLVISAPRLCDGTGMELCKKIKESSRPSPVILMTDRDDEETIMLAHQAGVDEFLSSPPAPGELSLRIRRVIGLKALHSAVALSSSSTRQAATRQVDSDSHSDSQNKQSVADDPATEGAGHRILLAEDHADLRRVVEQMLTRTGYNVLGVADGKAAYEAISTFQPELVILDVRMPEMTGIEVCRKMKDSPKTKGIPVVMVTGVDPAQGAREAYQAGADDYLVKPVHSAELRVRIRTMLRILDLRAAAADSQKKAEKESRPLPPEPLDPLGAWFNWYDLWNRAPDVRKLRVRVSAIVSEYLDGLHEYKPELFNDTKTSPEKLRQAYKELRNLITSRIERFFWEEPEYAKTPLPNDGKEMLIREILNDRFAFGPIQALIDDGRITDILVNRYNEVHIELGGRLMQTPIRFDSEEHLRRIMTVVLRYSGKEVNESRPFIETRLRDGSRVSATVPPLSIDGATLTIRKFIAKRMGLEDLLRAGTLSPEMAILLDLFVKAGLNVIVSGATGAGKTTLLNLLGSCIPVEERIITVEDTAELQIRHRDVIPEMMGRAPSKDVPAWNMERFEARSSPKENLEISIRDIIRLALRKRPDRIIVGEVRGPEALDMLNAMNTGHRGCLTTIHANNTTDMMIRLENMVLEANTALPLSAAQRIIVAALSIAVQVVKFANNRRRITEVTEIAGFDSAQGQIQLRPIFLFKPGEAEAFQNVNAPSEKIRALVEEFLIRTSKFRADWDAPGTDEEALEAAQNLFRRHASVHFPEWMMKGISTEEKKTNRNSAIKLLSDEIFSGRADGGFGGEEEHEFLMKLNLEARIRIAKRLGLADDLIELLSRPDPPDRSTWEKIFPAEQRAAKKGELSQGPACEGIDVEDVKMSLYSATSGRMQTSAGRTAAGRAARIETLKRLMPYLRLASEALIATAATAATADDPSARSEARTA